MRCIVIVAVIFLLASCAQSDTLLKKISSSRSNIHFNNEITESDTINSLDMEFLYNGGGVAAGDFNRDGLVDLYFTASQVSNKMYLNKGDLVFGDITEKAGVAGNGRWSNAASVVDINQDGWPDLYVCATIKRNPADRANLLYVNQGLNKEGIPFFKEMAKEYHLADTGLSVHAAFLIMTVMVIWICTLLPQLLLNATVPVLMEALMRTNKHYRINFFAMKAVIL